MASMLFVLFIAAPLVLLSGNLGRGAVGLAQRQKATRGSAARRPRPRTSSWPVRPRRATPAVDPLRSLSPVAAIRREREAHRAARVAPVITPGVERAPAAPRPVAPAPIAAPLAALPVTASPRGFVPAPASAFAAGPALTPRRASAVAA